MSTANLRRLPRRAPVRTIIWSCGCITTRLSRRVLTVIACSEKVCAVLQSAAREEGTQP